MQKTANEKISNIEEQLDQLKQTVEPKEKIENKLECMEVNLTNKLKLQENSVNAKISSYAHTVKKNIEENEETKKEISAINSNFKELKTDVGKKLHQEKESDSKP